MPVWRGPWGRRRSSGQPSPLKVHKSCYTRSVAEMMSVMIREGVIDQRDSCVVFRVASSMPLSRPGIGRAGWKDLDAKLQALQDFSSRN